MRLEGLALAFPGGTCDGNQIALRVRRILILRIHARGLRMDVTVTLRRGHGSEG